MTQAAQQDMTKLCTFVNLSPDQDTTLSFGMGDVQGMRVTELGQLIINFADKGGEKGGQMIISNFADLAKSGVSLATNDGQKLDTKGLMDSIGQDYKPQGALAGTTLDLAAPTEITQPDDGKTVTYTLESGKKYVINLDPTHAPTVTEKDGTLVIAFDDGGKLVLKNFEEAMTEKNPAEIAYNGEVISMEEFLASLKIADTMSDKMKEEKAKEEKPQAEIRETVEPKVAESKPTSMKDVREANLNEIAKKLAGVEPAAGEEGGSASDRGGYGFNSSTDPADLNAKNPIGPIGPTALQFGLPEFKEDVRAPETQTPTQRQIPPSLTAPDSQVLEDGSIGLNISAAPPSNNPNAFITVEIKGIPLTWGIDLNGGTYDPITETWSITLPPNTPFTGGPILSPPVDSDADLTGLLVTVTSTDPTTGLTTSTSDTFDIIVDAVADEPVVVANDATVPEDSAAPLNISATVGDTDGSETITKIIIHDLPAGFTPSAGTFDPITGDWTLTPAQLAGLTITPPANFSGSIDLDIEVIGAETNKTDADYDTTNDTATTHELVTLTWTPVADEPNLTVNDAQVKEDGSVFVPVDAKLADRDGSEFLTITVSGVPAGATLSGASWTPTGVAGEYRIVLPAGSDYTGGFTITPPANSDIDINDIKVTATSTEVANGDTADTSKLIDVVVDAVADQPTLVADDKTGAENTALAVEFTAGLTDTDGSEVIVKYQIYGVPDGFTLNHGVNKGAGMWELTPADMVGLQVTPPTGFDGTIDLSLGVFTSENPVSDGEFDPADNDNFVQDHFSLTWTPVINPPDVTVNGGVDNAVVKEDGTVDVPIKATLGADPAVGEFLTVTVTGINPAWGFSSPVGTYNPATGTWTVTLAPGQSLDTVMTFTPPANTDIDLSGLVATVVATDPASGLSASDTDGFNVVVDAVADKPTIDAEDKTGAEGSDLPVNIAGHLTDTDGSETITGYKISGVPNGFTLSAGTKDPVTGDWILTPAQLAGLKITPPAGFDGTINLVATVLNGETNTHGGEPDASDNTNSASTPFSLTWTPVINPPDVTVNNGVDNTIVKEDGTVDVPITAHLGADPAAGEFLTVTVTGINPAWGFSSPVGTYNAVTGTWTVTLPAGQNLNTVMTFTPPHNTDIDLSGLVATVVATDPASGLSASDTDGFNVVVDAVADVPNLNAGDTSGEEGSIIPLNIITSVNDTDGSEVIEKIIIRDVPTGATLTAGTQISAGVWELTPSQLAGLGINMPNNSEGTYSLRVQSVAFEKNTSGSEPDTTDNRASAFDVIELTVTPDDQPILVQPEKITVDETNLGPVTVSDKVQANFGTDGPGDFTANGAFTSGVALKSHGVDVVVTLVGDTYFGKAGTETIFTLKLNANGDYTFNLFGTLDHPNKANPDDTIVLNFGVTANDNDGDHTNGTITVNVKDDGCVAHNDINSYDAYAANVSGNVITGLNGGAGAADTLSHDTVNKVTKVTFGTTSVDVPTTGFATITGAHGTLHIFADGTYTYTPTTPTMQIDQFTYTLTDGDGDFSTATLILDPICHPVNPPDVTVNGGVDNAIVKEDGSVVVPIVATLGAGGSGNEILTVTVTGINPAWGFSSPLGSYNAATGTWTVTLPAGQNLNSAMTFTPPANSDIDLSGLVATATAFSPLTGTSASDTDGFGILVDAVADKPTLDATNRTGNEGQQLNVTLSAALTDTDGSEVITGYKISGVPNGFTLSAGTKDPVTGDWTLTPAQIAGLKITPPAGFNGTLNLTATVFNTENPVSDGEVDLSDNNNSASDAFTLTWKPVINPPCITVNNGADCAIVKEDHSVGVPVTAALGAGAAVGEFLTVTVTGINSAWGFSAPVGTYNAATGTWTVTLAAGQNLNTVMTFTPPHDSDLDLSGLMATAVATDPAAGLSASSSDGFGIIVDAVADAPTLNVPTNFTYGGPQPLWWANWLPLNVSTNVRDTDGSESISKIVIELPAGAVAQGMKLNHGTEISTGVWELHTTDLTGLQIWGSGAMAGTWNIKVTSYARETTLGGSEVDYSDNIASTSKSFCLTLVNDPLLLDLNGDGVVELTTLDAGVMFDMNHDGVLDRTAWIGANDGLLTLDRNNDGTINDISELFGDAGQNAFDALAGFDANADHVIDAADAVWSLLQVWQDANQDGVSQSGELLGLDALGIESIGLTTTATDAAYNGNIIIDTGVYLYNDGSEGKIVAAGLATIDGNALDQGGTITGTGGADELVGASFDETIVGGFGNDVIYGGGGADTFLFQSADGSVDTIKDFNAAEGDKLDLSGVLASFDPLTDAINDFVFATVSDGSTTIKIDATGSGNVAGAVSIAVLDGVTGLDIQALYNDGRIAA